MTIVQQRREQANSFENDLMSIGAGVSVTFYMGSGTDTGTSRYLNLPYGISYGIEVMPTVACSISKINGKSLKAAISVGTGGFRMITGCFTSITVSAGSATVVEVLGKC